MTVITPSDCKVQLIVYEENKKVSFVPLWRRFVICIERFEVITSNFTRGAVRPREGIAGNHRK